MIESPAANRSRLPVVVVEEHHEAFFVWQCAIARGWIPAARCVLLHIDEHPDLRLPRLRTAVPPAGDPGAASVFAYRQLGIGNFILPAVLQGIFHEVVWLRASHTPGLRSRGGMVRTRDEHGRILALDWTRQPFPESPTAGDLTLTLAGPGSRLHSEHPVVLDVDLDYFGCPTHARGRFAIEVTRESFNEFNANPYHFLRLQSVPKVSANEQGGACMLEFDHFPETEEAAIPLAIVESRLDALLQQLQASDLDLCLAVICRSVLSGYTDPTHAELLERRMIEALSSRYEVQLQRIDQWTKDLL